MTYDVFPFFAELELLEIRLRELDDFADVFVLVESPLTFSGNPKPLVFAENRDLFRPWLERIRHVVVNDEPPPTPQRWLDIAARFATPDCWIREAHQFIAAGRGMPDLKADDIILWCCVDELPDKRVLRDWLAHRDRHPPLPWMMMMHKVHGYLNCYDRADTERNGWWTGGRVLTGAQWLAAEHPYWQYRIPWLGAHMPGGWHFCNVGGPERMKLKHAAYSHQEYNIPTFMSPENLEHYYQVRRDLYDPLTGWTFERMPWDQLPTCIGQERERFAHLLLPESPGA